MTEKLMKVSQAFRLAGGSGRQMAVDVTQHMDKAQEAVKRINQTMEAQTQLQPVTIAPSVLPIVTQAEEKISSVGKATKKTEMAFKELEEATGKSVGAAVDQVDRMASAIEKMQNKQKDSFIPESTIDPAILETLELKEAKLETLGAIYAKMEKQVRLLANEHKAMVSTLGQQNEKVQAHEMKLMKAKMQVYSLPKGYSVPAWTLTKPEVW